MTKLPSKYKDKVTTHAPLDTNRSSERTLVYPIFLGMRLAHTTKDQYKDTRSAATEREDKKHAQVPQVDQ